MADAPARHPSTTALLRWFDFDHLPAGPVREASALVHFVAHAQADTLPDGPELSTGLRKLLESKDCFVRAAIDAQRTVKEA